MITRKIKYVILVIFVFSCLLTIAFSQEILKINKVIDGDTLLLNTGEKIRLIGVDTPELYHPSKPIQYFAKEASMFAKKLAEGKEVRLEYDWQKKDKYDRTLAYVFLKDGTFLNAEIVKQGYGFAYTKYPFKYLEQFREYEKTARAKGIGLWGNDGKAELDWIVKEGLKPFLIYEIENNLWAIRYEDFVKTRVTSEELMSDLLNLRIWVHEYSPKDLRSQLTATGWKVFK